MNVSLDCDAARSSPVYRINEAYGVSGVRQAEAPACTGPQHQEAGGGSYTEHRDH